MMGTEVASKSGAFTSDLGASDFSGTFTEYVYRGNSYGANDLTWYIQVMNNGSSGKALAAISASDFTGFATDVGYVSGTGVVAPDVSRGPSGGPINFLFPAPNSVDAGVTTAYLTIVTDAVNYGVGHIGFIDDGTTTVAAFAPTAIPEPATWAMMFSGFLGLGLAGYRKSRGTTSFTC